jgi:hypothetical protein
MINRRNIAGLTLGIGLITGGGLAIEHGLSNVPDRDKTARCLGGNILQTECYLTPQSQPTGTISRVDRALDDRESAVNSIAMESGLAGLVIGLGLTALSVQNMRQP